MINALKQAFVDDHRHLTRGLTALRRMLRSGDIEQAKAAADELNVIAGPHIEFEERCFYPALKTSLGASFVAQLYREHRSGRSVLDRLATLAPGATLSPDEREALNREIDEALEHVYSCGTLVSHIDRIDQSRQAKLLEVLEQMRADGRRWTDLPRHSRSATA